MTSGLNSRALDWAWLSLIANKAGYYTLLLDAKDEFGASTLELPCRGYGRWSNWDGAVQFFTMRRTILPLRNGA